MSSTLLRTVPALRGALRANPVKPAAALLSTGSGKASLPDLPYDYNALEPYISAEIMQLHHSKHHQTYVNGLNSALDEIAKHQSKGDLSKAATFAPLLNFHGGGHRNHSLFWENLAPASRQGGGEPAGSLKTAIDRDFGSFDALRTQLNTALAGIQGSGWAWLVRNAKSGTLGIVTRANQDTVAGADVPLLGIDAWEHAYYLQYQNRKAEYFDAVWNVVNWKTVASRFEKQA
ncbi:hypothetical protein P8C59_008440 [Phyllachora maydis]|uniref:Superoxide dismutase n=1 Tax=Phyllachora maydis TaxID=1825666 RepID=A0AAD9MEK9_9PEZI|nr:hypothetical protein P8C59_008440 [Phyllachora maydis]